MYNRIYLLLCLAVAISPAWSQDSSPGDIPAWEDTPMLTPFPINQDYSMTFASETPRTNYLRGSLALVSIYDDNMLPYSAPGITDIQYSAQPSLDLQQSRARLSWEADYRPGFKFYQRNSSLNGVDHALQLGLTYRLAPHVTMSLSDTFQKTSDLLYLSEIAPIQQSPISLVPPTTPKTTNVGTADITYQFSRNGMIGAKGAISGLWYQDRPNLSGLYESASGGSDVFVSRRLTGRHYVGVTYGFQELLTRPGDRETQTHRTQLFYQLSLPPTLTLSIFGGPEHSHTHSGISLLLDKWTPSGGASLVWQREHASCMVSYLQGITEGGGLSGAVQSRQSGASVRWQLAKRLVANVGGLYSTRRLLDSQGTLDSGGHTWSASASLQHPLSDNLAMELGYTRLHQTYPNVAAIAEAPDRDNIWVSVSYQFARPFGR